jgi:rSAM/selenodomain-associated transferase 1
MDRRKILGHGRNLILACYELNSELVTSSARRIHLDGSFLTCCRIADSAVSSSGASWRKAVQMRAQCVTLQCMELRDRTHLRPLIIVFAKAPIPGRVKTRLGADPLHAAALHAAFVRDTLAMLEPLRVQADLELSTDRRTDEWAEFSIPLSLQSEGDLGQRMFNALDGALSRGRPKVVIVGSDSPLLPSTHLVSLLESAADLAIGPTDDGGYYAIACRKTPPAMFNGVRWSTAATLQDTLDAASRCGLKAELGSAWFDVDFREDLDRLLELLKRAPDTKRATSLLPIVTMLCQPVNQ